MRTDANGNPGNFTKVFNTNRGVYERTLNDGAYTLLLTGYKPTNGFFSLCDLKIA